MLPVIRITGLGTQAVPLPMVQALPAGRTKAPGMSTLKLLNTKEARISRAIPLIWKAQILAAAIAH